LSEQVEPQEREDFRRVRDALTKIAGLDVDQDLVRQRQLGDASFISTKLLFEEGS
jgi:hypothetical protein